MSVECHIIVDPSAEQIQGLVGDVSFFQASVLTTGNTEPAPSSTITLFMVHPEPARRVGLCAVLTPEMAKAIGEKLLVFAICQRIREEQRFGSASQVPT